MIKMRRPLALVLAAVLSVSLAACGGNAAVPAASTAASEKASTAASTEASAAAPEVAKDAETGLTPMANTDPITFSIFIRDPGQAPAKDNPVLKKITELTGVTMDFQFVVGDVNQKLGVMIAAGDYPDVCFADAAKLFDAGALIPVEDELVKYPNLKAHYEPFMDKMKAGFDGEHAYTIENYNAIHKAAPQFENGGVGFFIQKAVLADAGYKIPKTVDEYFGMIEAYKAKYPTIDGVKTIGFEVLCDGWRDFCLRNPAQHLMGAGNDGDVYVEQDTLTATLYQISDTAKSYYKKLNEEYHKGIIEAETFTQSYDQYIARLSTGAVLGMFDQGWNFGNATSALRAAGKDERTYVSVPITNPGVPDAYMDATSLTITGTGGLSITKNCKNVDRLLSFYDWLIGRDVQDYIQWGVEGKDFTVTDGVKMLTAERRAINKDAAKRRDLTGDTLWQYSPKMQGLYEDGQPCGPGDSADEYLAGMAAYDQKFLTDLGIKYPAQIMSEPVVRPPYYPVWSFAIEDGSPAKVAKTKIEDVCRKWYPQMILADAEKYDGMWAEFLAEIEASSVNAYPEECTRQIKERMDAAAK